MVSLARKPSPFTPEPVALRAGRARRPPPAGHSLLQRHRLHRLTLIFANFEELSNLGISLPKVNKEGSGAGVVISHSTTPNEPLTSKDVKEGPSNISQRNTQPISDERAFRGQGGATVGGPAPVRRRNLEQHGSG
ncbi:hypothetical protein EVAR_92154_1 [Eumeta japonica]|uniref:Uncharacterized protein n=1 Tax=Eumeta variegata TaxID=151549 RepID=A0A4C1SZ95_EUMVA|nr:hypothetical protein EVAR_92154_1 [Eumeta japonica]